MKQLSTDRRPAMTPLRSSIIDERGNLLRATWHQGQQVTVISIWHGESCAGTIQIGPAQMGKLVALMTKALREPETLAA